MEDDVKRFVDQVKVTVGDKVFAGVCALAEKGRMRWGETSQDWGPSDDLESG